MSTKIISQILLSFFLLVGCSPNTETKNTIIVTNKGKEAGWKNGDIIFQESRSGLSEMIQLATQSKYSHVGIVYENEGKWMVLEAVQPVQIIPIERWTKRGKNGHYVLKRLKDTSLIQQPKTIEKMKTIGKGHLGKDYDGYFEWSDTKMYCSELVWKIYHEGANIDIGSPQLITDFDLSHPVAQRLIKERYNGTIPSGAQIISPAALFDSPLLQTVRTVN